MSDIALTVERTIDAPADAVWRVITDVEGFEAVLSGVTRVERLAGAGYTIGTRWRETRRARGRDESQELEVVGIDEGRSTMLAAESHGLAQRTELTLEPAGGGTVLRMRFAGTFLAVSWVQRVAARLTAKLGASTMRTMMQQDLDDIAAAAEGLARS